MNNLLGENFDKSIIDNKVFLITGGTGSFGNAFTKTLLDEFSPKKVIIFSRDEDKQHYMRINFQGHEKFDRLRFFIGDIRDLLRLEMAMIGVDYIIHAAALKHVPAAEYNPFECIKTNVYGAENIVNAAIRTGVKKVIALSTDKAANPVNLYGASKLASDKIFVAANNLSAKKTLFSVVRYGNVIGSRGSVVPLFRKLIEENKPYLPITHEDMTRFWLTINQGVNFVLSSIGMMNGGEVFVPKIPSAKITDVAKVMAPEKPIKIIGIRPGEKLHEIMITPDDARNTLDIGDRYIICPEIILGSNLIKDTAKKLVPEDFQYASNTNSDWLSNDLISIMIDS